MNSQQTLAKVEQISPLTDSILQIILSPDEYVDYRAGQYLQISIPDNLLSYSIANAPLGSHKYELHIRHGVNNCLTSSLLQEIKHRAKIPIVLPFGDCELERLDPKRPILFIAAGTGFAPIKAMIEQLLADGSSRPFSLYWGARSKSDLYMDDKALYWQAHLSHFNYYSMLSTGGKDTLASLVLAHRAHDIQDWQIVINGPFEMVYATRDQLLLNNVDRGTMFSDAFSFETV